MIKSHPSEANLFQYVAGELSAGLSLVMATHVDMCSQCQAAVADIEETLCKQEFGSTEPLEALNCEQMMAAIFASSAPKSVVRTPVESMLSLEGKRFNLPNTLARNRDRIGPWSHMVGKLWRAPMQVSSDSSVNLIYMAQGATVPEHTHKGTEATLVVNGTFNDEHDSYHDGDFILLNEKHRHSPQTQQEDCLTLASLDAPLHFTSGISRLLNPFSSLFFR
ncbi:anti-ECFsigma factor, ChrR [Pseudidiomarina planktonica]|uniref:Anti-ECFsigma factor, ChrR n=1 Tax=Pseudidiomarina planktonica TaxID=1323738 RepID=A0A1Y6ERB1_9GAMM|nr:ChrR family anti-sigma-E factor [Pseudidiomarina planktonica]RUO65387.1 transcriptional regulator [Pseudidiomarina planktonica]SMQ65214.1 anti-ECFsigma factor, ChrR [Pseudidiomarina planktonica]